MGGGGPCIHKKLQEDGAKETDTCRPKYLLLWTRKLKLKHDMSSSTTRTFQIAMIWFEPVFWAYVNKLSSLPHRKEKRNKTCQTPDRI